MAKGSLVQKLHAKEVDAGELGRVLLDHFLLASGGLQSQRFSRDEGQVWIELHYTKGGKVDAITKSDDLTDAELDDIIAQVEAKLIGNQVRKVGRRIVFSGARVTGFYRDLDFQFLPIPPDAPKATKINPARHPFILEHSYTSAPDFTLSGLRRTRRIMILVRMLNLILTTTISVEIFGQSGWVHETLENGETTADWKNLGYYPRFVDLGDRDQFSSTDDLSALTTINTGEYLSQEKADRSGPLELPIDLGMLTDHIRHLSEEEFQQLVRATAWFSIAAEVWLSSRSCSYTALVSAIEVLMPRSKLKCEKCGQPLYSLNKTFKEFLGEFAPAGENEALRELERTYYGLRSGMTHGDLLHAGDIDPTGMLDPTNNEHERIHRTLSSIVRIAIIRWLATRKPCETTNSGWS